LVLDRLVEGSNDGRMPGLARHIRLVTGASGGMVGGAYFATLTPEEVDGRPKVSLVKIIEDDIAKTQDEKKIPLDKPLPRDTLTDVLQQLVAFDILHLALPLTFGRTRVNSSSGISSPVNPVGLNADRGRVLQSHWPRIGQTFESLQRRVLAGTAPSIIFSPMLVETGQPLLISDLDLAGIAVSYANSAGSTPADGGGVLTSHTLELFNVFPSTFDKFTLQTAARMNAAFPVISPAVDLPTDPPRRIADAGYFDNYGMATALAYLNRPEIRAWLQDNKFAGALIVQITAFPVLGEYERSRRKRSSCDDDQPSEGFRAIQWLTTPLEGLTAARERSMAYRGERELEALKDLYLKDGLDLERVFFENTSRSSFSWYLPQKDLDCMKNELNETHNRRALAELERIWRRERRQIAK
jgi:hypothetical protein